MGVSCSRVSENSDKINRKNSQEQKTSNDKLQLYNLYETEEQPVSSIGSNPHLLKIVQENKQLQQENQQLKHLLAHETNKKIQNVTVPAQQSNDNMYPLTQTMNHEDVIRMLNVARKEYYPPQKRSIKIITRQDKTNI